MILPSVLSPICFIAHLLSFNTGSAGPAFVGLELRETLIILTIVDILTCAVPAFFTVFGPKLGMRDMIQSRFPGGTRYYTYYAISILLSRTAPAVPSWTTGFENGDNISSLISAVLSPIDGFGKFLTVLVTLSVSSACAPTMYTFGTSFMAIGPVFQKILRYVFAIISEAMSVSLEIVVDIYLRWSPA